MERSSNSLPWFLMLACVVLVHASLATASRVRRLNENNCQVDLDKLQAANELPEFIDISVKIRTGMVTWDNLESNTKFFHPYKPQKHNQVISTKIVNVTNHIGTHIDSPAHMNENLLPTNNVDFIDLRTLNGPALVLQVPPGNNLTDTVLESMKIPRGVKRVLFKTDNSDKNLWDKEEFFTNFTAFKESGANWLVNNRTDIKLVGIDFLSTATYDEVFEVHSVLLKPEKKIVPLEGLDLRRITPGWYMIYCLPLNVEGVEGTPTRCIASPMKVDC